MLVEEMKMDKSNITVTMPVSEYERLKSVEEGFNRHIKMFERANVNGTATMTDELKQKIEEIYC